MTERTAAAPLLIGHRGAPGYRPEHTASSYRLAFEQGVDAVEPDIVVSSDGVLVIRHENEISGTTDVSERPEFAGRRTTKLVDGETLTGWFAEDFTWAELATLRCRERLPGLRPENTRFDGEEPMLRLLDLLDLLDEANARRGIEGSHEIGLVIELKHAHMLGGEGHDLVTLLLATLETRGPRARSSLLTIECFELTPLERLQRAGLAANYVFLLESRGWPADEAAELEGVAHSFEWYRSDAGLDSLIGRVQGISVAKRDLLRSLDDQVLPEMQNLVQRAHARGLSVYVWTLRPENAFLASRFRRGSDRARHGDWRSEWHTILVSGVDGVFLDHPDLLAQIGEV